LLGFWRKINRNNEKICFISPCNNPLNIKSILNITK
jgi:hypothetical protein